MSPPVVNGQPARADRSRAEEGTSLRINVVLNRFEELKERVPTER
jgi:hypothetical protein